MSRPRRTPPPEPPPEGGKSPATNRAFAALVALLGLDQRQIAAILQISSKTVSAYVSGKKKLSLDNFRSKCAAFGKEAAAFAEQILAFADRHGKEEPGQYAALASAGVLAEIGREAERLAAKAVAEKEWQLALALWSDLKKLEADHWRLVAAASTEERRSWAFVKVVGEESAQVASVDADRALELARFALWVAERVPGVEGWVSRVFAWAFLANALRVKGDLKGAAEASARSARLQAEPPEERADLPEPWRLLDLEASLRIELRQLPEALRLLAQAEQLAPRSGPIRARILCIRSNVLERLGDSEGSIAALREALAEIGPEAEPHLFCLLQFNLADSLTGAGQAAEAEEMLPALQRMQGQLGDGLNLIRLRWLEGKIDAGLGRLDRAIEALSWVRAAFHEKCSPYDEAQAGVELAELYLKKGRTADTKRLVRAMAPVFRAEGVHVEAQKALDLFRHAVEREAATAELAGRVARYLHRAQHEPELVFEEAA